MALRAEGIKVSSVQFNPIGKTDKLEGMELRHLRYFCAVAEYHGFSSSARALHVSQSAISEQNF